MSKLVSDLSRIVFVIFWGIVGNKAACHLPAAVEVGTQAARGATIEQILLLWRIARCFLLHPAR